MKLHYILFPMEKAAAWQVVGGKYSTGESEVNKLCGEEMITNGDPDTCIFDSNSERDKWIAAVHKHLAEWAYGKIHVSLMEAWEIMEWCAKNHAGQMNNYNIYNWGEKWMKPREPKHLGNFLWEV